MRTVIVIPAFNESATLRDVVRRALSVDAHVIVVDDGSTDGTAATIHDLPVDVRAHPTNLGKAASLWTGFQAALDAHADIVVTLDGDGQHRPEDVPRLLAAAKRFPGFVVIAARLKRRDAAPRTRRIANAVADFWLSWTSGHRIVDSQSGQRAYPARLLRTLVDEDRVRHDPRASFTLESEILIEAARHGSETVSVPIDTLYPRAARPSHFRPLRDITRIVCMVSRHLIALRFHPHGLWRALADRSRVLTEADLLAQPGVASAERLTGGI